MFTQFQRDNDLANKIQNYVVLVGVPSCYFLLLMGGLLSHMGPLYNLFSLIYGGGGHFCLYGGPFLGLPPSLQKFLRAPIARKYTGIGVKITFKKNIITDISVYGKV